LQRLNLPTTSQEQLTLALEEAERIRTLLSEILRYAKPQSLQLSQLEMNGWIRELLKTIPSLPAAASREIDFIPAPGPVWVRADQDKLKQVLINLIDNACEAVSSGEVIRWQVQADLANQQALIQIDNGGDPIPPEVLSQVTKPFYTTKVAGTGLGLAIVKRIVDAHDGHLAIASDQNGTRVTVGLPLSADKNQSC
jgi:signal transduction histidine kinase